MEQIKEAFKKVKEEMNSLKEDIDLIKQSIIEIQKVLEKNNSDIKTLRHINPASSTHPSTHNVNFKALKPQNLGISTGNAGASTDRQTDRQTDTSTHNSDDFSQNSFDNALEILDSLDEVKKEIRLKFKRLTDQEMKIFGMIYQIDQENNYSDYKVLAKRLNLTESSIRDYIGRLIKKGIPIEKTKINNKNIQISISNKLKQIASLSTILHLREL